MTLVSPPEGQVLSNTGASHELNICAGVREGCVLSLRLFLFRAAVGHKALAQSSSTFGSQFGRRDVTFIGSAFC